MDGVADWQPLARVLDERVPQRLTISPPDLRGASQVLAGPHAACRWTTP